MLCFYHNVWIFLSVRKEIHRKVTKLHRKNYTYARKYFPSIRINVIFSLRLAVSQQYKIKQACFVLCSICTTFAEKELK